MRLSNILAKQSTVAEAGYGSKNPDLMSPSQYDRYQQDQMDYSKRAFKQQELAHELGDEEEYYRQTQQRDAGTWYIRINGKLLRDKQGNPYTFRGKQAANKAALTMMAKPFNKGKDFILTTRAEDKLPGVTEEKTRLDPKCWKGKKIGNPKTKMKGGVRVNNCVPAESVAEGAEFGSNYAEQLAKQVYKHNPDLDTSGRADRLLNVAYSIAKSELGARAQGIFRDEDFPGDFVSAYSYLKKWQGVTEAIKKPNATTRHLRDYPVSDKDVAKPVKPEKKKDEKKAVAEAGMPSSVIKSKQRYSQMTPAEFAQAHKDKSDEELISMAWRHGYGKGSKHYVDKRNKGKQGVAEATGDKKFDAMMGNIKTSTPVPVSGYVAVTYASENNSNKIKGVTYNGKPMPTSIDDPEELTGRIEFTPDRIEQHLIEIGQDNGWDNIDPGHGRGFSELFFDTNANYTSNTQSLLAKNIVNTVTQINNFFNNMNNDLQSIGLPGYKFEVWQEIASSNGQKIGDLNQIKKIAVSKIVQAPNDAGEQIGKVILRELPKWEADDELGYTPEDFAWARKVAKIYITKGERAGLKAQAHTRARMSHVSDMIDELLGAAGATKLRTIKDLDEQGVAEGSGPKEKQKTPYRDINSPEYRKAADKQKQQMAKDAAAEPGKKLADKIAKKGVAEGYTGRETKDGTWRVFKDGKAVAVAGPFKSREEAAAWIKKQKQGVAEGRFDEPLTGWHIVYRNSGNPVHATPSFETKEQAQKYLMTKMFANHQDFKVVHTAGVGLAEGMIKDAMMNDAEKMSLEQFCDKYGDEDWVKEFYHTAVGTEDYESVQQGVAEGSNTDLRKKIDKYEELALQANKAGDDAKSKMYQQKIQSLKQKMSQGVAEGSDLPPRVIEMIKKIAQSSASPEHKKAAIDALVAKYSKQDVAEAAFKDPSPMFKDSIKQDKIRSLKNLIAIAKEHGRQLMVQELELELKKLQGVEEGYDSSEYSDESGMAHTNLITIARAAQGLLDTIDPHEDLPEWVQEKIAKVEGMLVTAWDYLKSQEAQGIDPRITKMYNTLEENLSRRGFLKGLGAAALGATGAGVANKAQARVNIDDPESYRVPQLQAVQDLGNGFVLTTIDVAGYTLKAVLDTQTKTYITLNRRPEGNGAIIRNMAPYIVVRDGKVNMASTVGPATAEAMKKAGLEKMQQGIEENYTGKGNHRPGWMLKADPELAKKFKDKQEKDKARQKAYGNPGAGKSIKEPKISESRLDRLNLLKSILNQKL